MPAELEPVRPEVGAMTVDVEDYFQVEAFAATVGVGRALRCAGGSAPTRRSVD